MPIDASIPLQVQTPNIDGLGLLRKVMSFRQQQQQMDLQKQTADVLNAERTAQTEDRQLSIAQKQKVEQQNAAIDQLMSTAMKDDPTTGVSTFDRPTFEQGLIKQGLGHLYPTLAEHLDKLDQTSAKVAADRRTQVARSILAVQDAGNTPGAVYTAAAYLQKNGAITRDHMAPILAGIADDPSPEHIDAMMKQLGEGLPEYRELLNNETKRKADLAKTTAESRKTAADASKIEAEVAGTLPEMPAQKEAAARAARTAAETERHNRATEAAAAAAHAQAAGDVTDLTPAGLDAAALNYAKTGTLPPLGMGDKTTRKKIINRAAEMMPGLDVASAKADFEANKGSLTGLQKQRDAIGAFESTALKNLDVFLEAAKKIPDTGSPLFNRPLRSLNEKLFGDADLAAYNTARRTVIPEFAKILANPGLSGQLSDSARKEVEDVVSGNATLKQTIAAVTVLKRDTENRRTSYDDQIAGIKQRISKAEPTASAGEPKDGQDGTVNGTPAVWKTVNGKKGWYAK